MKLQLNVASVQSTCAVRPAQPYDCEAMADLARQLGYECTAEEVQKRLRDMQDANQYTVLVAEFPEGQIAGWIGAYLFRSIETGSCVEINGLVVDESIRSRGIGRILLGAARRMDAEHWFRCHFGTFPNVTRGRAHQFYTNNGYAHVKTQKEFRKTL